MNLKHSPTRLALLISLTVALTLAGIHCGWNRTLTKMDAEELPNAQGEQALTCLHERGLYTSLGEAMQNARYNTNWVTNPPPFVGAGGAYRANNPAQSLNAFFTEKGLYLSPSDKQAPGWEIGFKLTSCGYGDDLLPIAASNIKANGTRVEIEKLISGGSQSTIAEWYENRAQGLEHGFTINQPPAVDLQLPAADRRLRIVMSLSGDLHPVTIGDGRAIDLTDQQGGQVLSYGGLVVKDAAGRELVARMTTSGSDVAIEVDDSGASYPIVIDPTFTQQTKLTASDGAASDRFGHAVAISGNTVVIGADMDNIGGNSAQGSAYVFVNNGTAWLLQSKLIASDGADGDGFGFSVAIDGDSLVVGSWADDIGSNFNQGSAYVFVRNGASWTQQSKLIASDGRPQDFFGSSTSINGDTVVVGAYQQDIEPHLHQGSAYVFTRNGTSWNQQGHLVAADGASDDLFGISVSISGDTVAVGALDADIGANGNQGAAYVFVRNGTTWSQQAKLTASDGLLGDEFGNAVSIDGDTVAIAAWASDIGANQSQGSVYVFVRSGSVWARQARLTHANPGLGDLLGVSLSLSGQTIVAGAGIFAIGNNTGQGSAYVFVRSGTTWTQQARLTAADGVPGDQFGFAVGVSGTAVVVGAPLDDVTGRADQGSAYVFAACNGSQFWTQQSALVANDGAPQEFFGFSLAISGETAVVGAFRDNIGVNEGQGSAYVFVRNGTTWALQAKLTADDGGAFDVFGWSVSISDDTIVVGAEFHEVNGASQQGSAYVYVRSGTTWSKQAELIASDGAEADAFGASVAISGNTLVVGAEFDDVGANESQGSAYVFVRSGTTWSEQAKLTAFDGTTNDALGLAIAIDDDTVVVSASNDDFGANENQGSAYVFVRSGTTWTQQAKLIAPDGAAGDLFGYPAAIDGDTILVGAHGDDGANTDQGSAYVFVRSGTTWTEQTKLTASDTSDFLSFGSGVALDGDTAVIGAAGDDIAGAEGQGSAYVFVRTGSTWTQQAKLTSLDGETHDNFGNAVALSHETVIVGAARRNGQQGAAYIFARSCCPQITLSPTTLPIATQGQSYGPMITASGGAAPYTFGVTAGSLPPGLTLSQAGLFSGTPTVAGTFNFTVTASDVNGCPGSRAYSLLVLDGNFTWTGSASTNWHTASNWANNTIPNIVSTVIIPSDGVTNEPNIGFANAFVGSIFIAKNRTVFIGCGQSLTINHGAVVNGTLIVGGSFSIGGPFDNQDGTVDFGGCLTPQTVPALSYNNLRIDNPTGVSLGGDTTVTGELTLNDDLQTGSFTLTMPAAAISGGHSDCLGNVKRTGFVSGGSPLSFGNPTNTIQFNSGTPPADVTVNLVKAAPANFPNAARRSYTITPNGGSGYSAILRLHYLDTELNGNDEATLQFWRYDGSSWHSQGATSRDLSEDWLQTTGVTQFSLWTLAGPGGPTAIDLVSFNASAYEKGTLLEWQTGFEADNLGFNIYRDDNGSRRLVNTQLIAGSALTAAGRSPLQAGEAYAWWDNGIANCGSRIADCEAGAYWLEDIDLNGHSTLRGPFPAVSVSGEPPAHSRATSLSSLSSKQAQGLPVLGSSPHMEIYAGEPRFSAQAAAAGVALADKPAVKILVRGKGWYQVGLLELIEAGLNPAIEPSLLQLFAEGQEVPISVATDRDGRLEAIQFYGIGLDTPYTDARVYWLVAANQKGKRIRVLKSEGTPSHNSSFTTTVERRDRSIYFSALRNGERENFFGSVVTADAADLSLSLQHVDPRALQPATIEVALQGVTLLPHRVVVQINGGYAGEVAFDGQGNGLARFAVPHSLLSEGANQVRLIAQNGSSDISLVDYIKISYEHTFTADDDELRFRATGGESITIDGFSSKRIRVFDITDPTTVTELVGAVDLRKRGYAVTVAALEKGERVLLALASGREVKPDSTNANRKSHWRNKTNAADFIIITARAFFPALEPLVQQRQSEGLSVAVVDVEDIYDEFSFGNKSPQSVKDFLSFARSNWKTRPRFVMFAGDASYDPRIYLGLGYNDIVPTKLVDTAFLETASDDWFADFNADGIADVAVGRLPVSSVDEATSLVGKLVRYGSARVAQSALLVSDTNDSFNFEQESAQLRPLLERTTAVEELQRGRFDPSEAKARLIDAIRRGQKIVNYVGHGSVNRWRGDLLTSSEARELVNDSLPVMMMMTCLNGYFHDAASDSLAESLIKAERGGAIAVWASSGITFPKEQAVLNQALYRALFGPDGNSTSLGEALLKAKAAVSNPDVRKTWILIGDPTTRLK